MSGVLRNPMGFGEKFSLRSGATHSASKEVVASLSIPAFSSNRGNLDLSFRAGKTIIKIQNGNILILFDTIGEENKSYFTSFSQRINSVLADYTSRNGKHRLVFECSYRDEVPYLPVSLPDDCLPVIDEEIPKSQEPFSYDSIFSRLSPIRVANKLFNAPSKQSKPIDSFLIGDKFTVSNDSHKQDYIDTKDRVASPAVQQSTSDSMKSSLKYQYTAVDSRDSIPCPTDGQYLQGSVEIAVPPGNAQFVKSEVVTQYHKSIGPPLYGQDAGLVVSFCGNIGLIYPLTYFTYTNSSPNEKLFYKSYLSDRYQLGGPLSLRGFDISGTGSRSYPIGSKSSDNFERKNYNNITESKNKLVLQPFCPYFSFIARTQ